MKQCRAHVATLVPCEKWFITGVKEKLILYEEILEHIVLVIKIQKEFLIVLFLLVKL
jgi:hypothetical protein